MARVVNTVPQLHQVLQAAILAPSPDNNQPWQFQTRDGGLFICADWTRGLPSDIGNMFMYQSLGAAVENACIAASTQRVLATAQLTHDPCDSGSPDDQAYGARLDFTGETKPDPLAPYLADRVTCRKAYATRSVDPHSLTTMSDAAAQLGPIDVEWITERRSIRKLAGIIARCDLVRLQYQPFHEELYKQLRFTPAEAERTRDGLDVRTLELPPGAGLMLRALKPWPRMQRLHAVGLGKLLAIPSAVTVRASGAIGILTVPARSAEWFFRGGRALQRLWLAATAEKVSLQPLGSLPIFLGHLERASKVLTPATSRRLEQLRQHLQEVAPSTTERVLMMIVRVGYCAGPSQRSLRRPVEDFLLAERRL